MRTPALLILALAVAASGAGAAACPVAESRLALINLDLARDSIEAADQRLAPLESACPDDPQLLLPRARIKAAQGDATAAQSLFSRFLELAPDSSSGKAYFARFLIDQGAYQQADTLSEVAFQQDPGNPAALAVRGQILDMKHQTQQGLELLTQACKLAPDDAEAQFQIAQIYDRAKRPADAAAHFQKTVELDPGNASAWDYLALNLESLGEVDGADAAWNRGLEVDHEGPHYDAFLDYNYGRFLTKRNDLAGSLRHLDRAVELVPQFRGPWYYRAKLNLRLKHYKEARSDAEKAASLNERASGILDLQIYALLEQIYRHLGETALADKYADLTRQTPPPVRKDAEETAPH